MDILAKVRGAGVVGAGGAGFPTHVKLDCRAEVVIANGAECEPLLRVDQQLMEREAVEVITGLRAAMQQVNAKKGVIYLKEHYTGAITALRRLLRHEKAIGLHIAESYYPAGDEQQIIYEVTRRVVPPGGLPKDVGSVICNVGTLAEIARALRGVPVIEKYVTVGGAVNRPVTVRVPVGTPLEALIDHAGGTAEDCTYIIGGPCMGQVTEDITRPVTKTTGGLLAIPKGHPLLEKKNGDINYKVMQSVCCQCTMCTQMCPRNALGLGTSPHKAMRALVSGTDLVGDIGGILSCCDCGMCTYFACNFGLKPALVMRRMKQSLMEKGLRTDRAAMGAPDRYIGDKQLPTSRIIARLGLDGYDVSAHMEAETLPCDHVRIPMKMHIGAPGVPVVKKGNTVRRGDLIMDIPEKKLGAKIHASISGTVLDVTDEFIEIKG